MANPSATCFGGAARSCPHRSARASSRRRFLLSGHGSISAAITSTNRQVVRAAAPSDREQLEFRPPRSDIRPAPRCRCETRLDHDGISDGASLRCRTRRTMVTRASSCSGACRRRPPIPDPSALRAAGSRCPVSRDTGIRSSLAHTFKPGHRSAILFRSRKGLYLIDQSTPAIQEPGLHLALALDVDEAALPRT